MIEANSLINIIDDKTNPGPHGFTNNAEPDIDSNVPNI